MSDRLAISAAFSLLMMSAYVLLSANAVHGPVGPGSANTLASISALPLPSISWPLPAVR